MIMSRQDKPGRTSQILLLMMMVDKWNILYQFLLLLMVDSWNNTTQFFNLQIKQHIPDLVANDDSGQMEKNIPVYVVDDDDSVTSVVSQYAEGVTGNDTPVTADNQKNSQDIQSTITLSNLSQTLLDDTEAENDQGVITIKTYGKQDIQTDECTLVWH